jgi:hypothetical protein
MAKNRQRAADASDRRKSDRIKQAKIAKQKGERDRSGKKKKKE